MTHFEDQMEWLQSHTISGPASGVCLWAMLEIRRLVKELAALTAERDALAAEIANLRTLEEAAIAYRHAYIEVEENEPEALQALFRSARDAEKARNA